MSDATVTIVGNLTKDGELRFTKDNTPVYSNSIAVQERVKDADGNWTDGDTSFYNISAFGSLGENFASLNKGTRVLVTGAIKIRPYEKDGEQRQSIDIKVEAGGPDLKWATASVEKSAGKGGGAPARTNRPAPDEEPFLDFGEQRNMISGFRNMAATEPWL